MIPTVPEIIANASHKAFGRPFLDIEFLDLVVGSMVGMALAPDWTCRHQRIDSSRFVHATGVSMRLKFTSQIDRDGNVKTGPRAWAHFSREELDRDELCSNEELYVLACHTEMRPGIADHRDALQWRFYVVESSGMPTTRRILLSEIEKTTAADHLDGIAQSLNWYLTTRRLASMDRESNIG